MVDRDQLLALVPHYVAMLLIVFVVVTAVRLAVGNPGFWAELAIVTVIVFLYRPLVLRLDVAPPSWERER